MLRKKKDKDKSSKSKKTGVSQEVMETDRTTTNDASLLTPSSRADIEKILRQCREWATSVATQWKRVAKESDVEEFVSNAEIAQHSLGRMEDNITQPTLGFYRKLRQFSTMIEEYNKELLSIGKKLASVMNSTRRRRILAKFNSRMHSELKYVLDASGMNSDPNAQDSQTIKKRSLSRISVPEGQNMWQSHFADLDMEMVPWDRFIAAFQIHTNQKVDLHDEILLKHVLDNDNLGVVTPKEFNSFLKCFGPIGKTMINLKDIYKQKWFHDFLSVEEVIRLLADQPPGTFLVRFSRSKGDAFALEYVESKEENNVEKTFSSLSQLIQHYSDTLRQPFHSDLLHKNWFFGDVSTEESEQMLQGRPPGTFMIRFSDTGRFQYVASYVAPTAQGVDGIRHVQILKVPSGYTIDMTDGSSLPNTSANTSALNSPSLGSTSSSASLSSSGLSTLSIGSSSDDAVVPPNAAVYPSLSALLKACRATFRYNYDPENVPRVAIAEFMEADKPIDLRGPGICDGIGMKLEQFAKACARTVATYPRQSRGWEVICDQFFVRVLGNRAVFALADGCNWGTPPRDAAIKATEAIIDQVADKAVQMKIKDTIDCKHFLLRSFSVANDAIIEGKSKEDLWSCGTTTLMAGILAEVDGDAGEWALVCVSVGDCKAFVWNEKYERCVDVTAGNRRNLRDARDPGGRLGPYLEGDLPDLRNLASYFWPLSPKDVLLAVSDGVHDNFDPESLGLTPADVANSLVEPEYDNVRQQALKAGETWDGLNAAQLERIKWTYGLRSMRALLKAQPDHSVASLCDALVDHSVVTTNPSRSFMEANPNLPEPGDHKAYPGKMDHTTCVALSAGYLIPKEKLSKPKIGLSRKKDGLVSNAAMGTGVGSGIVDGISEGKKSKSKKEKGVPPTPDTSDKSRPKIEDLKEEAMNNHAHDSDDDDRAAYATISTGKIKSRPGGLIATQARLPGPFEALASKALSDIPKHPITGYATDYLTLLTGPAQQGDTEIKCGSYASAWSTSTYPTVTAMDGKKQRLADPNTNHFVVEMTPNRQTFALSSGCSWGQQAYDASLKAISTFLDAITAFHFEIDNLPKAALALVKSFDTTHAAVVASAVESIDAGTALLLGGLTMKIAEGKWGVLVSTIGNLKCFVWSQEAKTVRDITKNNSSINRADSGGRLGPFRSGQPDTRNFATLYTEVDEGDIVILMSPGAYHNLDPELLGQTVQDIGLTEDSSVDWATFKDQDKLEAGKTEARSTKLQELIEDADANGTDTDFLSPSQLTRIIIDHSLKTTSKVRQYMQNNPSAREPKDFVKFPGHATAMSFIVGPVPKAELTPTHQSSKLLSTMFTPMKANGK